MKDIPQNKNLEIWALLDGTAGHDSQVMGVVEAMKLPFTRKKLTYNDKASRPNFLKFNALNTIDSRKSDIISEPYPDIIISCGRKAGSVALAIKKKAKKSGKKTFINHILWPGFPYAGYDMISVPSHDSLLFPASRSKKIFRFIGAPNRITKEFLLNEYRIWARTIGELPSPKIAVLVGGDSKRTAFTEQHARALTENVIKLCSELKATLLITNSRRTSVSVTEYMQNELKRRVGRFLHFHDFNKSKANPFYAFLQLADMIIVTGDSISMCSESCATAKPVYIYSPEGNAPEKHRQFHQIIIDKGYASNFDEKSINQILARGIPDTNSANKSLNASQEIADEILKRVK
jgi:mitochondrial fission protein ELM1